MKLCSKCNSQIPWEIKINDKIHQLRNRKFCLTCSPFNSHNTKDLSKSSENEQGQIECKRCNQFLPKDNFYNREKNRNIYCCKTCWKQITIANQRRNKQKMVDYKGGKCNKCGYKRCIDALDFHHLDPSQKTDLISRNRSLETCKSELDKCILLCSNCHREFHAGFIEL